MSLYKRGELIRGGERQKETLLGPCRRTGGGGKCLEMPKGVQISRGWGLGLQVRPIQMEEARAGYSVDNCEQHIRMLGNVTD